MDSIEQFDDKFAKHNIEYDVADVDQKLTERELLSIVDKYHGVIAGDDEFTRQVLAEASQLQVISKWGIGIDAIDTDAADEYDIDVYNTPGAFADEVADVVIGYTIMLTRQLHDIDRAVRDGNWFCPRGVSLTDKTFGIIGVGSIGAAVARRAHALGMDVLGSDIRPLPDDLIDDTEITSVSNKELLRQSDIVSLNCALTDETYHMIGQDELRQIGEKGYLINTARGELVDQDALVDALQEDMIAGAALDVFEEEPIPENHPLTRIESAILGSHNAQNTYEAVEQVNKRAVENLITGLDA